MFHFGFSYVGLVYLLMLFLPNAIWAKHKPEGYEQEVKKENKVLQVLERIGEALSSCCVLIFSDFNVRLSSAWSVWLLASFLLMLLYEVYWVRYFRSERKLSDFYRGICGIPVAGATLPVCAFFLLGIYGSNVFLLASTILLGIGHIGIHLQHRKEVSGKRKVRLPVRVLQGLGAAAGLFLIAVSLVVIGCRNGNYFRHYRMIERGVDEGTFVTLGGAGAVRADAGNG